MGPESPAQHVPVRHALNLHALLLPEEHSHIQQYPRTRQNTGLTSRPPAYVLFTSRVWNFPLWPFPESHNVHTDTVYVLIGPFFTRYLGALL